MLPVPFDKEKNLLSLPIHGASATWMQPPGSNKPNSIHPSIGPSTPIRGLPPPPGSHTRHAPLWCLARLSALISFPHPPQVTILTCPPLLTPTPTSRPPSLHPPTRPNMSSIIYPTYPPPTSPALPPISLPPPPYAPPVQLLMWLTLCPSASKPLPYLTLQPPPLFIRPMYSLLVNN